MWSAMLLAMFMVTAFLAFACAPKMPKESQRPNILFVLTDDQDAESIMYMPTVQEELASKGTTFANGILTVPDCCPSRVTMLRGQYARNHGIGSGVGGQNRAQSFKRLGLDKSTVATWLQDEGYKTALFGKYLNGYESLYVPPGWNTWFANDEVGVWANCLVEDGQKRCYEGRHPDSVLTDKAETFIRASEDESSPLFLWISFNAPHRPAPYTSVDRNKFADVPLLKPPSFDEKDVSDKPEWVKKQESLTDEQITEMAALHRDRLRSLQSVDRGISRLLGALADTGRLKNTYIFFWTDNGHHLGQHRLPDGKATPYMEDIRVPLIVRGPNVAQAHREEMVLNTDIAPTFADIAGAQTPDFIDGRSLSATYRKVAKMEDRRND